MLGALLLGLGEAEAPSAEASLLTSAISPLSPELP